MYYVFQLAPNQTPLRDSYFVEKLLGIGEDDGVAINAVFAQVWNMMGLWPATYAALLLPAARSGNRVPAWPFITGSFALGMYILIPYFALWSEPSGSAREELPPAKDGLGLGLKITESPIFSFALLAGAGALVFQAATAGDAAWLDFGRLFKESRLVHVTTLDFMLFTALTPFWMYNDAQRRGWAPRDVAVPALALLPLVGPAVYLCLRPKAQ